MTEKLKSFHLFAGGGGGVLADILLGHEPVGFCEIEKAPRLVLKKRFPKLPRFRDVTEITGEDIEHHCGKIDLLCGGSPCQDVSSAGKRQGFRKGAKSSLIWHQVRLMKELQPKFMFWENVAGSVSETHRKDFLAFVYELEAAGYGGAWCLLGASQIGAPHERMRVWLLAKRGHPGGFKQVSTARIPHWKGGEGWPSPRAACPGSRPNGKGGKILAEEVKRCGPWPTPGWADGVRHEAAGSWVLRAAEKKQVGINLHQPLNLSVRLCAAEEAAWATPCCHDASSRTFASHLRRTNPGLDTQVKIESKERQWATPMATDASKMPSGSVARQVLPGYVQSYRTDHPEYAQGLTAEEFDALYPNHRINATWVDCLMGWPRGWTDLTCEVPDAMRLPSGQYLYPAGRGAEQYGHEPPRIIEIERRTPEASANNKRLKMLGNGQNPDTAVRAYLVCLGAINSKANFF